MKASVVIFALLGNAFAHVISARDAASAREVVEHNSRPNEYSVLVERNTKSDTPSVLVEYENSTLAMRSNEDWTLVIYEDASNPSGKQCGGTSQSLMGSITGRCITGLQNAAKCVDFSVAATPSVAGMECTVKFSNQKCGNDDSGSDTQKSGTNIKGYNTGDVVKFINVECQKSTNNKA